MKFFFYKALIIGIIATCASVSVMYFYKISLLSRASLTEPIILAEKADAKTKQKFEGLFSEAVKTQIHREYDTTITNLNLVVTAFGIVVTLVVILMGFVSFGKIRQLSDLAEKVESQPDKILGLYFEKRLISAINQIFDANSFIRAESIRELMVNPKLSSENLLTLRKAFDEEFMYSNNPNLYMNINSLANLLFKLNPEEATERVFAALDKLGVNKVSSILLLVCATTDKKYIEKLKNILATGDFQTTNIVSSQILMTGSLRDEYLDAIFENPIQTGMPAFLSLIKHYLPDFDYNKITQRVQPTSRDNQFYVTLMSLAHSDNFPIKQALELLVAKIKSLSSNPTDLSQLLSSSIGILTQRLDRLEEFLKLSMAEGIPPAYFIQSYNSYRSFNPAAGQIFERELGQNNLNVT